MDTLEEKTKTGENGFLNSLLVAGAAVFSMGSLDNDSSLRTLGAVFVVPTLIKYSVSLGNYLFNNVKN